MSLAYAGDSVVNSASDVVFGVAGFLLASRLTGRAAALWTGAIEAALLLTIRDSMLLNVLMVLYPIEAVRRWQLGG
jgi:hypothetical protein